MMYTKTKFILIGLLLFGFIGCDSITNSFTEGYNENPNNPTDAPAPQVFRAGQVGTVAFLESHSARKGSMWAQYFSGADRQYSSIHSYNLTATDSDSDWFMAYVRGLTNLRIARTKYSELPESPQNNVKIALTKVYEAMLMGQVTALWGDVPFTEASNYEETQNPAYDAQSSVYGSVQTLLNEAISTLGNNTTVSVPNDDVSTLEGSASDWLGVANTLKARYLMHTGDVSGALAAAQNGISADDGSGDLKMPHGDQQARNQNFYYAFTVVERSGYLRADEAHATEMLNNGNNSKTDETDRYEYFYTDDADGTALNNTDGFAADTTSFPFVTYLENELIKAQAQLTEGTDPDVVDALNNTREYLNNKHGSGNYDDLTVLDFQTGVYSGTTIEQHVRNWTYLGLIGQIEGFNYVRRIDYNVDGLTPVQGSEFPQRFIYPQAERNTNGDNLPDPVPTTFDATPVNQ